MSRSFLFLQGVCSPFFAHLADRLSHEGHRIFRINFNTGDWLAWAGRPAWHYRGPLDGLEAYLGERYRAYGITDQILFGDCRPVHRPAIVLGKKYGVRTHVFEEGYFRPYWVTLEREGVNSYSLLPRNPDWYREVGAMLPDHGDVHPVHSPFIVRAAYDVLYHVAGSFNPLFFPRYRTHASMNAAVEYLGYLRRLPLLRFHRPRDAALIDLVIRSAIPFYFFPLQLEGDAQIRTHSRFRSMTDVLKEAMASFARHAPNGSRLLIKNHPLDPGLTNYERIINRLIALFDLTGRVHYLETGNLETLLQQAKGTVTVNSTVGALALGLGCPTIALSQPIYNLPGLTFQGPLDAFWREGAAPDSALFRHFRTVVIHATQVNGGFYCRQGITLLVENCHRLLAAKRSPLEHLL